MTERKIAALLRHSGCKVTPQRRAVLRVIARSRAHLSPASLHEQVRQECPGIGLVTVYRTLEILARMGLLCEVHTAENQRGYLMRRPAGHHHHLVCSDCGRVVDFSSCDLSGLAEKLGQQTGFQIKGHLLEFQGQCRECQVTSQVGK